MVKVAMPVRVVATVTATGAMRVGKATVVVENAIVVRVAKATRNRPVGGIAMNRFKISQLT